MEFNWEPWLHDPGAAYRRWLAQHRRQRTTEAMQEASSATRQLGAAFDRAADVLRAFQAAWEASWEAMSEAEKEEFRRLDASP